MAYFSSTNWSQYRNVHDAHIGYLSEEKGSRSKGPLFISVVIGTVHWPLMGGLSHMVQHWGVGMVAA